MNNEMVYLNEYLKKKLQFQYLFNVYEEYRGIKYYY